jgi:LmbE family N-acetylglucosaminyl deacetylase
MRAFLVCLAASIAWSVAATGKQATAKTLVAVIAHPDDEGVASPILARYAREGVQVHLIIATDGAAGGQQTSIPRGPELARVRAEEARCATDALGLKPPILLGFPDGQLGNYAEDPVRLFRLTQRVHEELQRLRPDALITWGPDGGTGHPDHRLVSAVVTQLARTGAPGVP